MGHHGSFRPMLMPARTGFADAAVKLQRDWLMDPESLPFAETITSHMLVTLIQKGLQLYELEEIVKVGDAFQSLRHRDTGRERVMSSNTGIFSCSLVEPVLRSGLSQDHLKPLHQLWPKQAPKEMPTTIPTTTATTTTIIKIRSLLPSTSKLSSANQRRPRSPLIDPRPAVPSTPAQAQPWRSSST